MPAHRPAPVNYEFIPHQELCDLEARLLNKWDNEAAEQCIAFIEAESFRVHHGRFRAKMSRRLKHCELNEHQRDRLVRAILNRFLSGRFSEQFKDQLQLVIHLAPEKAFQVARIGLNSQRDHVRRYAHWILRREPKTC
jgi:hypothetical protein